MAEPTNIKFDGKDLQLFLGPGWFTSGWVARGQRDSLAKAEYVAEAFAQAYVKYLGYKEIPLGASPG